MAGLRNEKDLRNSLINSYIKVIELVRPKVLFFENVSGFAIGFKQSAADLQEEQVTIFKEEVTVYSQLVLSKLRELGYDDVQGKLLDFSEYGVPQSRKRFIIIGTLAGNSADFYSLLEEKKHEFLSKRGSETSSCQQEKSPQAKHVHFPATLHLAKV